MGIRLRLLPLLALLVGTAQAAAPLQRVALDAETPRPAGHYLTVPAVLSLFRQRVSAGEVLVFDTTLTPERLRAERVEYAYAVDGALLGFRIFASLEPPLDVPEAGCRVIAVHVELTPEGDVGLIRMHVEALD